MAVERVMSHWIDFSLLSSRPVIFNVGAGSGDFARQILREIVDRKIASTQETHVVCVDPFAKDNELMAREGIAVLETALGSTTGKRTFHVYPEHRQATSLCERCDKINKEGEYEILSVDTVNLRTLMEPASSVDYLNMDIEGEEWTLMEDPLFPLYVEKVRQFSVQFHLDVAGPNWRDRLGCIISRMTPQWECIVGEESKEWFWLEAWFGKSHVL